MFVTVVQERRTAHKTTCFFSTAAVINPSINKQMKHTIQADYKKRKCEKKTVSLIFSVPAVIVKNTITHLRWGRYKAGT